MNQVNFCNSFVFNIFKFDNYHFTDCSKNPVQRHYFGYLTKGTCIIKTAHTELTLKPGEVFYIPKGLKYQSQWFGAEENKIEFYSFGFAIAPTENSFVLQKISCTPTAKAIFEELRTQIPFTEKGIGILYRFFGEVAEQMEYAKKPCRNSAVEKATQYISQNPYIKISQVAAHCNMSESAIYSLFKKHIGKTPNEFRLQVLCEQAVNLLSTTDKSVQEISDTVGFSSTSYFRKILKKHTGKTPLQIRKESAF